MFRENEGLGQRIRLTTDSANDDRGEGADVRQGRFHDNAIALSQ